MASVKEKTFKTARIPLVGQGFDRDKDAGNEQNTDQIFTNCVFSVFENPETGKKRFRVRKRPAMARKTALATDYDIIALGSNNGELYYLAAEADAGDMHLYNGTSLIDSHSLSLLSSYSSKLSFGNNGTASIIAWIMTYTIAGPTLNVKGFWLNGSTITEITDSDFPGDPTATNGGAVGNIIYKDGYWFVMTLDGSIYNSDLNDITSWSSTSVISRTNNSDQGSTLVKYKDKIVAFRKNSIEFYELAIPAPSVGSPLQRIDHLTINFGVSSERETRGSPTVLEAFNSIYWVGSGEYNSNSLFKLEGFEPKEITTSAISSALRGSGGILRIAGKGTILNEPALFFWTDEVTGLNGSDYMYVLFLHSGLVSRWTSSVVKFYFASYEVNTSTDYLVFAGENEIYRIDNSNPVFTNNYDGATSTNTFDQVIQTSLIDLDTEKRKRLHKLKIIGDTQSSSSPLSIQWSDNDYTSFTTARNVDLNTARPYLSNCGSFRRRSIKLTHSAATPCELEAIEIDYSELGS